VVLDATRPFPLPDSSIDHVFSEHMIEHLSHAQGIRLLREAFRVLKPGGRIRIATPNLEVLLRLYSFQAEGSDAEEYIRWFTARHMPGFQRNSPAFVINHFFYNWGHCFIYDRATLEDFFREAGLTNLEWCQVRESCCPALHNLERHGTILGSQRWNAFETMVLEGVRP
jgi:predicted SAM-dependent methyltransferase